MMIRFGLCSSQFDHFNRIGFSWAFGSNIGSKLSVDPPFVCQCSSFETFCGSCRSVGAVVCRDVLWTLVQWMGAL